MFQNTSKLFPKSLKSLQGSCKSNHNTIIPLFSKSLPYLNNYNSTIKLLLLRFLSTQPFPPLSTPTSTQITTPQLTPSLPERPKFFLQKDFDFLKAKISEEEDKNEENERPLREKVILLSQRDKLEEAVQLVLESDINDQSEITWNQLIVECVDKGRVKLGIRLLNEMKRFSLQPSQNTYTLLLNGLAEYRALPDNIFHARAIVDGIRRSSRTKSTYRLTVNHANSLLKVCFRANEFEALISNYDVFFNPGNQGNLSLTPNKETNTIVLAACAKNCKKHADQAFQIATNIWSSVYERAMYFVRKPSQRPMKEEDSIDDDLVCAVLLCFRNTGQVEKGFEIIRNIYGIGDDTVRPLPYNIQITSKSLDIMLGLCFKSQQPELGVKLFSEARIRFPNMVPDIQNFNSLISLFNETKRYDEAIGAFKQVLELGLEPGSLTFDLLMESCKNTKNLDIVKDIFGIIIKHRVIPKATALTKILEMTMESDSNIMVREVRWILNKVDQIGLNDPISLVESATRQGVPKLPFEIDDETFLKTIINAYGVALDKSGGKLPDNTEERWKNNLKFYKTRLWDLNQKNSQIEQSRFLKDKIITKKKNWKTNELVG
ncbi:6877_t:CDS:2 [Diversispora eburnea]|uniref:6877_t:CDS:1 n=1 Tax=Diversispora eburnea TaxID=1213867 RepID=A0A9N9B9G2_9GLOM|nr:6877_t:CDS:2 [Diversispora eburnea]